MIFIYSNWLTVPFWKLWFCQNGHFCRFPIFIYPPARGIGKCQFSKWRDLFPKAFRFPARNKLFVASRYHFEVGFSLRTGYAGFAGINDSRCKTHLLFVKISNSNILSTFCPHLWRNVAFYVALLPKLPKTTFYCMTSDANHSAGNGRKVVKSPEMCSPDLVDAFLHPESISKTI